MIMRIVFVKYMKPICYLLPANTQAIYANLFSRHDMDASMCYYFPLMIYVLYVV